MKIRTLKQVLCLSTLTLVCAVWAEKPPNVVIILSDDQSWTDYGFMGHEIIQTPHLDKLAENGVLFERGYVPTALCRPSLMTLATGLYASQHKICGNDSFGRNTEEWKLMVDRIKKMDTLAKLLGEQGYVSHQSGKWWEGSYKDGGFTEGMTRGFPSQGGRHGDAGLKIGRQGLKPVTTFIDEAAAADQPFFVWYAPYMPHAPHTPPQRLLDKYIKRVDSEPVARYYAMIEWFDETCGDLLGHLEKAGVRENTLVVYLSDNGWIQDPEQKNTFLFGSKMMPQDTGVRQPTIYSWPAKLKPERRADLVSSIDILPTICAAAGARLPEGLTGISLLEAMETSTPVKRERIFGESYTHDVMDINDPEKTLLYRWVIEGQYKLILTYAGAFGRDEGANERYAKKIHDQMDPRPQLYDLLADPAETKNLAGEKPDKVKHLVEELETWYPVTKRSFISEF